MLNAAQEKAFKRQRSEWDINITRGECNRWNRLNEREKRCLQRAWLRLETKVDKKSQNLQSYK